MFVSHSHKITELTQTLLYSQFCHRCLNVFLKLFIKGELLCKIIQNYVSAVCTQAHYCGKNPSAPFVIFHINLKQCFKMSRSGMCSSVTSQCLGPAHNWHMICPISLAPPLSEPYTVRHVYLLATAFNSGIQGRNVILLKLLKLFSQEQ